MNLEKLLNYVLTDGFGRLGMAIESLLDEEEISSEMRTHLSGFGQVLQGKMDGDPGLVARMGAFASGDAPEALKEIYSELRREGGDGEEGDAGDVSKGGGDPGQDDECDRGSEQQGIADGDPPRRRGKGDGEGEGDKGA